MCEELNRKEFHEAIDTTLSGLQADPWLAQRVVSRERTSEPVMKKKLSISLVLVIVLILIAMTALAVVLLSPKEIVEQVAVPIAQTNNRMNYTYDELSELLQKLNENGITLDEGTTFLQAFHAGYGYWEEETIHEICRTIFGTDDLWTMEQKHWYGKMLVAAGVWEENIYLLPGEDDLSEHNARLLAVSTLKNAYNVDLPLESNESWVVTAAIGFIQSETSEGSLPSWELDFIPSSNEHELQGYTVSFDLQGKNVKHDILVIIQEKSDNQSFGMNEDTLTYYNKLQCAISEYGEAPHFWPDAVKLEVYGGVGAPYAIPEPREYNTAIEDAKEFVEEQFGTNALINLGGYKVGYIFQKLENTETNITQLIWDIIFTTDVEYLSNGYRVQFQRIIHHDSELEEIVDLNVSRAYIGDG